MRSLADTLLWGEVRLSSRSGLFEDSRIHFKDSTISVSVFRAGAMILIELISVPNRFSLENTLSKHNTGSDSDAVYLLDARYLFLFLKLAINPPQTLLGLD